MADKLRSADDPAGSPISLPPLTIGASILVVEDCLASAEAIRLMARGAGLRVRHAKSLDSARRHLAAFRPALVIVDLGLPDGDGVALIDELARGPAGAPPVLAISADPDRAASARGTRFALKPFAGRDGFMAAVAPLLPLRPLRSGAEEAGQDLDALVQDDLARARAALTDADRATRRYGAWLLRGLAAETGDRALDTATRVLIGRLDAGEPEGAAVAALLNLCAARMGPRAVPA